MSSALQARSTSTSARRSRTSSSSSAPCARPRATTPSSRKMGHPIEYLDVGGGLAIDYDGSRSTFHSSMNYTLEEYARDVVYNITDICDEEKVPHPHIVSRVGPRHRRPPLRARRRGVRRDREARSLGQQHQPEATSTSSIKDLESTSSEHLTERNLLETLARPRSR